MKPDIKEQLAKKITMNLMKEYHGYRPDLSLNVPGLLGKFAKGMSGEKGVTQDPEYMKMMKKKLKASMGKKLLFKRPKNAAERAQGYDD
jgi:hypothetical protein